MAEKLSIASLGARPDLPLMVMTTSVDNSNGYHELDPVAIVTDIVEDFV